MCVASFVRLPCGRGTVYKKELSEKLTSHIAALKQEAHDHLYGICMVLRSNTQVYERFTNGLRNVYEMFTKCLRNVYERFAKGLRTSRIRPSHQSKQSINQSRQSIPTKPTINQPNNQSINQTNQNHPNQLYNQLRTVFKDMCKAPNPANTFHSEHLRHISGF
jgi:GTPase SAR1 family protein